MNTEKYRGWLVTALASAFLVYGCFVWYQTEHNIGNAVIQDQVSQVNAAEVTERVYALGTPVGIYLETEGVLVADISFVETENGEKCQPAYLRLKQGDYITAINGEKINSKKQLMEHLAQCAGDPVTLDIRRNQEDSQVEISPVRSADGTWQLGIWARDNMQGIGILTYVTESGNFGALGHGIHDTDTGQIMEISRGLLYESTILSVVKGEQGTPGELLGMIDYRPEYLEGVIDSNDTVGIFGHVSQEVFDKMKTEPVDVLPKDQVQKGDAVIRTCVDGKVTDYNIRIVGLEDGKEGSGMIIEVTDERLLDQTGGIVQGMSGSPIIQNGKLAGAVTHVFIQDSTRGCGVFAETMLKNL